VVDVHSFTYDSLRRRNIDTPIWWRFANAWKILHTLCPNLQTVIFVCNQHLGRNMDIDNLREKWEHTALKTVFDLGRRELALKQKQGKLKDVNMKVMEWK
jgi:hypothetical protein